jgi:MFS transporter, UMF1 family
VLTYIFAPYLGELMGGTRSIQGIVNSASMITAGLMVPLLASIADHTGRARLYLIISSLACIGGLALFGVSSNAFVVMALFFIANVGYNAALVFYNALLTSVAADQQQGLVSGLGVGFGYIGTMIIVVLLGLPDTIALWLDPGLRELLTTDLDTLEKLAEATTAGALQERIASARGDGLMWTFVVSAGIFLLLALPSFMLVRERRVLKREKFTGALVKRQFGSLLATVKGLPRDRAVMWFLLGNFFCVDVLNTAILFFGDFTRGTFFVNAGTADNPIWQSRGDLSVFGYVVETPGGLLMIAGLSLNVLALLFGVLLGFMTDRFGSLRTLRFAAGCLVLGLLGAAFGGGNSLMIYLFGICGFGALGLAGIWTAGRKLLIELSPREKLGEYFGLYGITLKLSVIGSSVFGIVYDQATRISGDDLTGWKVALAMQAVPLLLGLGLLALVRRKPTTS